MVTARSSHFAKVVFWFLCLLLIPLAHSSPVIADPGPSPLDGGPEDEAAVGVGQVAPMAFQPAPDADSFAEFVPPGAEQTAVATSLTTTTNNALALLTPAPAVLVNQSENVAVSFNDDKLGFIIESDTLSAAMSLVLDDYQLSAIPTNQEERMSLDSGRLVQFEVEIIDDNGQIFATFPKPVRMVLDLREYGYNLDEVGGYFYLAYADEETPGRWHEVPIQQHGRTGLISAEVTHFSDWTAGWRPEAWALEWAPPTVSEFTGAATYQYAFDLPPGRNGLQPQISLSYSSASLRGAIRQVSHGTVATGWSLSDISITRTGIKNGATAWTYPDSFRLTINGSGGRLLAGEAENGVTPYYVEDMPGIRVYNYGGRTWNQEQNGNTYWIVQTGDGTHYRLGYTDEAVAYQKTQLNDGNVHTEITAWHVDTVTDSFGNQINYAYFAAADRPVRYENWGFWCPGGNCWWEVWTYNSQLTEIQYNFTARITALPVAHDVARLESQPGAQAASRVTLDYDNTERRLSAVHVFHHGSEIHRYLIDAATEPIDNPSKCDEYNGGGHTTLTTYTRVVHTITAQGYDKVENRWVSLPANSFEYTPYHHFTHLNEHNEGECFQYLYLTGYENGYGGRVEYTYESDGRQLGEYRNCKDGGLCDPAIYPDMGYNLSVSEMHLYDGRADDGNQNDVPTRLTYQYQGRCYDQLVGTGGGGLCAQPETTANYGNIGGYDQVQVTTWAGDVPLTRQTTAYHVTLEKYGRPTYQEMGGFADGNYVAYQSTENDYEVSSFGSDTRFTYTAAVTSTTYSAGNQISTWVAYSYDPNYQELPDGTVGQFGQLTHISEYDDAAADVPVRTTRRWYRINNANGHWTINQTSEGTYAGDSWDPLTITWMYYDGQNSMPGNPDITQGAVTRVRQFLIDPEFDCDQVEGGDGSGSGYVCDRAFRTIDQTMTYDEYGNVKSRASYGEYGYQTQDEVEPGINYNLRDVPATDPRLTTIDYDITFNLYPISTTTALETTFFSIYGFNAPLGDFQYQTGLLKEVTGPDEITTKYEYDPFGRLHAVYDGDASTGNPFAGFGDSEEWNGDPLVRYRYWDNEWNNGTQFLDPASDAPFIISVQKRPGSFPAPASSDNGYAFADQTFYDGFGRPIQSRSVWHWLDGATKSQEVISITAYDALGNTSCQTVPFAVPFYTDRGKTWPQSPFITDDCTSRPHTATTYDALGRPLTVRTPAGSASQTRYVYAIPNNTTVNGDGQLSRVQIIDANNHVINQFYNSQGQLVKVRENAGEYGAATAYADTEYTFDLMGNLRFVRTKAPTQDGSGAALRMVEMQYDSLGRKIYMDDPDMGAWYYDYDALGNLVQQEDANGNTLCMVYDEQNRLQTRWHSTDATCDTDDTLLAEYQYHPSGTGAKGQLAQILWPDTDNREAFTYDTLGRLIQHERRIDGRSYTMEYGEFDALHRPTETIYPDGEVMTVTYDHEGENSLAGSVAGSLVNNVTYNALGQMRLFDRADGVDTFYDYYPATLPPINDYLGDSNSRLKTIRHGGEPGDTWGTSFFYHYDPVGNIQVISDTLAIDEEISSSTQTFSYDHLNRLEAAYAPESSSENPVPGYDHAYAYDQLGNLTSNAGRSYQYNEVNWHAACPEPPPQSLPHAVRLVDNDYFCYDANGNMTIRNDETGSYLQAFDVENRLTTVTNTLTAEVTHFAYDASGQRVKTINPAGHIIYTPFPNYEEEVRLESWNAVPGAPFAVHAGSSTNWPLQMNAASGWAANGLPVAVADFNVTAVSGFPATSVDRDAYLGDPHDGGARAVTFNNLATGTLRSPDIALYSGRQYRLHAWVKFQNSSGSAAVRVVPYGDQAASFTIWTSGENRTTVNTWQEIDVTFILPVAIEFKSSMIELAAAQMDGWVAFDDLTLYERGEGKAFWGTEAESLALETAIFASDFEQAGEWTAVPHAAYPATSIWQGGSGPAAPYSGSKSVLISNLGENDLTSPPAAIAANTGLTITMQVQNALQHAVAGAEDGVQLLAHFYDADGQWLETRPLWHSDELDTSTAWQTASVSTPAPPAGTTTLSLTLQGRFYRGWLAFGSLAVAQGAAEVAGWDFAADTWQASPPGSFPAGTVWHGAANQMPEGVDSLVVYAFTNRASGTAVSDWIQALPYQRYQADAWLRGQAGALVDGSALWVEFYNGAQFVGRERLWDNALLPLASAWQQAGDSFVLPIYADRFRLALEVTRLAGWLALDDATLLDRTQPTPWQVSDGWEVVADPQLPASATAGADEAHSGSGAALTLHNLAAGTLDSPPMTLAPGDYTLQAWVRGRLLSGEVALEILPAAPVPAIPIWTATAGQEDLVGISGWQPITATFTIPAMSSQEGVLRLRATAIDGAVALDDVLIWQGQTTLLDDGFEAASGWVAVPDGAFPATSIWRGGSGPAAPHSGQYSFAISNLPHVSVVSPRIEVKGGRPLHIQFQYQSGWQAGGSAGGFALEARYYGGEKGTELLGVYPVWADEAGASAWQPVSVNHTAPADATDIELWFSDRYANGWTALDQVSLVDVTSGKELAAWDFDVDSPSPYAAGWFVKDNSGDFPAGTAYWPAFEVGFASDAAHFRFTNEAGGVVQTARFPAAAGETYHLHALIADAALPSRPLRLAAKFYQGDEEIGAALLWTPQEPGGASAWEAVEETFTLPPGSDAFQIVLTGAQFGGQVRLDGVRLAAMSAAIPAQPEQAYELQALVGGELLAAGQETAVLLVTFHNDSSEQIGQETVWSAVDYQQPTFPWQGGAFTTPPGTASLRVGLAASVDDDVQEGWLLADRVTLTALSPPMPITPSQAYTLTAQVRGELAGPAGAVSGQFAARFYNAQGALLETAPIWSANDYAQPDEAVRQVGAVHHATATQLRLATTVTLDEGWLDFSALRLQTAGEPLPVVGGQTYSITVRLSGDLPLAETGRLLLLNDGIPTLIWQNEAGYQEQNTVISHTFTAAPDANAVQLLVEAPLAGGWLAVEETVLVRVITRSTYMLAGQAVATRVTGDPNLANNGLFYLYSDHLGSASAIQSSDGGSPTLTRYLPYGGYRQGGPNPITDRAYTGQREEMDLGLYYYNARWYAPGLGRFISADSIVPDPQNPQQYNRYSYVLNSPLNFRDPSGHCATRGSSTEADECWDYLENEDGFCNDLDCGDIGWQRWVDVFGSSEHWNKSELELLRTALLAVKGTLQELGFANWTAEVGQYRFIRSEDVRGPWTDSDSFKINLTTRLVFGERPMDAIFGIIHEIGHVFDPGGEIGLGQSVLENVGAKRSFFGLGSLVSDGFCFRSHSCNSRSEFWADSFALYAINRSHSVFVENLGSTLPGGYILITGPLATARTYQDVEDAYLNGNYVKLLEAVQVTLTSR